MTTTTLSPGNVRRAIARAGRAPSVHNTQPWQFDVQPDRIDLYANLHRWLPATDGDRRDLMVSCGAVLHHLRLALAAAGVGTVTHRFPEGADADLCASVELHGRLDLDPALATQIGNRRSDRRPFQAWTVPEPFVHQLVDAAAEQGALLRPVVRTSPRSALVDTFARADLEQREVVGYRAELARWTGVDADADEGVPADAIPTRRPHGAAADREFDHGSLSGSRELEAGVGDDELLAVIGTASDDPLSQLRSGEALSAVLLRASALHLGSCALSQPLEVRTTRRVLAEDVLGGALSPQIVVRLGWPQSPPPPRTQRRTVDETLGRVAR